jgi:hypothetical protein
MGVGIGQKTARSSGLGEERKVCDWTLWEPEIDGDLAAGASLR